MAQRVLVEGEGGWVEVDAPSAEDAALEYVLGGDWGNPGVVVRVQVDSGAVRVRVTEVDAHGQASEAEVVS